MMEITLLRHTESKSNKENKADSQIDAGLTEKGLKDAEKLIPKLKEHNIDIFIVSLLRRTLETIKPFLKTLKIKPRIITSKLTLERDLGDFTGSKMGAFQKYCEDNNLSKVFHKPKNGESIEDTYKRAKKLFSLLKKKYFNQSILICGHKNFLMCLEIIVKKKQIKNYYSFDALKIGEIREFRI